MASRVSRHAVTDRSNLPLRSGRLQALCLDHRRGGGRSQELDQRLRRVRFLGIGGDARGEQQVLLKLAGKRTDELYASGGGKEVVDRQCELDLAAGNGAC